MEKRNFVTSIRTTDSTNDDTVDSLVKGASDLFGSKKKDANPFEKKASAEDEKSDRESTRL